MTFDCRWLLLGLIVGLAGSDVECDGGSAIAPASLQPTANAAQSLPAAQSSAQSASRQAPAQTGVPAQTNPQQPAKPMPILGAPPIEFHPAMMDLGEVRPNQRLTGTVQIHNIGDKWLKILRAQPDCTCTSVNLPVEVIAPGQAVTVSADYAANSVMGEKRGMVRFYIDGYDMMELTVRAFVTMPVRAEPPYVAALRDPATGQLPLSGEFTVLSNDRKPFSIRAVNSEPPNYLDFDPASDSPRNTYRLKWDFSQYDQTTCLDSQGRRMPGWVIIETDHPGCPVFDLEIRNECNRRQVNRNDTWIVQEKRVLLSDMKEGEPVEFEVHAKWRMNVPRTDQVRVAMSESNQFSVELISVTPTEDGMLCKVRVKPAAGHKGLVMGSMRMHSNSQSHPLVIIGSVQ